MHHQLKIRARFTYKINGLINSTCCQDFEQEDKPMGKPILIAY